MTPQSNFYAVIAVAMCTIVTVMGCSDSSGPGTGGNNAPGVGSTYKFRVQVMHDKGFSDRDDTISNTVAQNGLTYQGRTGVTKLETYWGVTKTSESYNYADDMNFGQYGVVENGYSYDFYGWALYPVGATSTRTDVLLDSSDLQGYWYDFKRIVTFRPLGTESRVVGTDTLSCIKFHADDTTTILTKNFPSMTLMYTTKRPRSIDAYYSPKLRQFVSTHFMDLQYTPPTEKIVTMLSYTLK